MRVDTATAPGSEKVANEDAVCASDSVAAVVDGVTAPAGLDTGCVHGTPWYARQLATHLVAASQDASIDLRTALAEAIALVANAHQGSCDLAADGTPSATVAVVRERGGTVDHLVLSDATVAIRAEGRLEVVTDRRGTPQLNGLRRAVHAAPVGSAERERLLRELITAQRRLRNVPGGYWLAGAIPAAAEHALTGSVPVTEDLCVAAMTDGASRLVDMFGASTWDDALRELQASGPGEWIRKVRELEAADADTVRRPRYKVSDDAALARCTFAEVTRLT